MNFLLHRHLGARDLGSAVAGIGAMLPDLWRMADRRMRPRQDLIREASSDEATSFLMDGIRHHLLADRWFHADAVFVDGEREAVHLLREANVKARHMRLFGHVLWELCLDGELVRREGSGQVLAALREGFERAGPALRDTAAFHRRDVAGSAREWTAFEQNLDRIREALVREAWVEGYSTGQGIAARISGVRAQLGLATLDREDAARVARVASALLEHAASGVNDVMAWRASAPPEPKLGRRSHFAALKH